MSFLFNNSVVINYVPLSSFVINVICLTIDARNIIKNYTFTDDLKLIVGKFIKECTFSKLYLTGKCIPLVDFLMEFVYNDSKSTNH